MAKRDLWTAAFLLLGGLFACPFVGLMLSGPSRGPLDVPAYITWVVLLVVVPLVGMGCGIFAAKRRTMYLTAFMCAIGVFVWLFFAFLAVMTLVQ